MRYHETLSYLYGLQSHGIKLGLDNITALLGALGNPHRAFPSIHVAGTNGKGSVSAMVSSLLRAAGCRVGLFTSPHLVSFTERIRVDSQPLTEEEVIGLAEEVRRSADAIRSAGAGGPDPFSPTFFEVVTAMAMLHFARRRIDIGVIEVGMGGRLDATNTIASRVAVITRIHVDHSEFLGSAPDTIAREKAAIMKRGIPVVSAPQEREVMTVIEETAEKMSCPLSVFGRDFSGSLRSSDLDGITFDFSDGAFQCEKLAVPLPGDHQLVNACVATKAAMTALAAQGRAPGCDVIRRGLSASRWPGRLEVIEQNPLIILDGAHNPDAARALADFAAARLGDYRILLVIGMMGDKDTEGVLRYLMPVADQIITCAPRSGRAASPERLATSARSLGYRTVHTASSVESALSKAREIAGHAARPHSGSGRPPLILVTGSLYTVGEARELHGDQPVLGGLREHP